MTDRELLQQVLEALEDIAEAGSDAWGRDRPCVEDAYGLIDALRARLAQEKRSDDEQPELEPVTCQIYGHVIGHCSECNVGIEKEANDSINETNHILATLYLNLIEQEPVAWMNASTPSGIFARHKEGADNFGCDIPLYTAPQPAAQPVPLNDVLIEAKNNILWLMRRLPKAYEEPPHVLRCIKAIDDAVEAAHGIGNKT